jgi:hypothetical protein
MENLYCNPHETNNDDLGCANQCFQSWFVFLVRWICLVAHIILFGACILHIVRFRSLFYVFCNPKKWKEMHLGTTLMFLVTLYGKKNDFQFKDLISIFIFETCFLFLSQQFKQLSNFSFASLEFVFF